MNRNNTEYDIQKRAKAGTAATLRAVVALYIFYIGVKLIRSVSDPGTSMLPWQCRLFGCLFLAAGLGVCYYAWRRWRIDLAAARIEPSTEDQPEEEPED